MIHRQEMPVSNDQVIDEMLPAGQNRGVGVFVHDAISSPVIGFQVSERLGIIFIDA
jgi:hypothetical protein